MKKGFKQIGFYIFLAVALLQLIAIQFNIPLLIIISKPMLMPVLAMVVWSYGMQGRQRNYILAALFFSFLGDSFLLLDDKQPLFFIAGLISFLITHMLYIIYFLAIKPIRKSLIKSHPYLPVLIILYGAGLVYFLYPSLGDLKIPVIIYAAVICTMLLCSIHIYKRVSTTSGQQFIMGALLFVVSDSLLAIYKFYQPFALGSLFIMLTYCGAQYFLIKGFVSNRRRSY